MTELLDLTRRVDALETAQNDTTQTLRWVVAKLGRMSAVQEEHTLRLERLENDMSGVRRELKELRQEVGGFRGEFGGLRGEVDGLRGEFDGLRRELPLIVADAMREVLRERG